MFNLLRMDLYRLKRSKALYGCLAFLLVTIFLCYAMLFLVGTPKGQELAPKIGMSQLVDTDGEEDILEGVDFVQMIRNSCMDGGAYNLTFGLLVAIFVCMDFQSGFIKNIMSLHRKRWKYVAGKLMVIGIADVIYLLLCFGFGALMNVLFSYMVPFGRWQDVLFYLLWLWLVTMAFAALILMICVFSRNMAVGVTAAILLGSGLVQVPLASITRWFRADGWFAATLYYNITYGPSSYGGLADLKVFMIGGAFFIIYSIISVIILTKQDAA
ncbi:MAG: ABC transporter permease [Ruminococcus sp.]|nr:ABC transporter permease [Ruminococcus sp.]